MHQLDIFDDSGECMRLNDLAAAIVTDDAAAAELAAAALAADHPGNPQRPAARLLIEALHAARDDSALPDPAGAIAARSRLELHWAPAAQEVLGAADARLWLARRWRALALRARGLDFDRDQAAGHPAALWQQAGAWSEMAAAVQGIPSWRRLPQALAWMAEARCHEAGLDACWPLLAELCWLAPARVPGLLTALPEARLQKWWRRFEGEIEPDSVAEAAAWFPAWLAIDHPLRAEPLSLAQAVGDRAAERCFRLVAALLRLERQGRPQEAIALRKQLRELQPALFALYMKSR